MTGLSSELIKNEVIERGEHLIKFRMPTEMEVDGIESRFLSGVRQPMFHLKDELDMADNPVDTGLPYNFLANIQMSETHWLTCGVVIPKNSKCSMCGIRGE